MRTNIPSFRLPAEVLETECDVILDTGAYADIGPRVATIVVKIAGQKDRYATAFGLRRAEDRLLEELEIAFVVDRRVVP